MKNMFFLFTALAGMTFSNAVMAEEGFYAGILGGANWLTQCNRHHQHVDYKTGYLVGASLGYTWCNNWSVEAEFTYRHNKISKIKMHDHGYTETIDFSSSSSFASASSSNEVERRGHPDLRSYAIMANVRYDFALDCCFTPYLRAGIGYANKKVDRNHHHHSDNSGSMCCNESYSSGSSDCGRRHNHDKNSFAYQVGLGFSMPVGCNTALDIGYNWLGTQHDFNNHSLVFAARYTF